MTLVKNKKVVQKKKANVSAYDSQTSKSLDELANAQGVNPLFDITKLFGKWSGKSDDGFEEMIHKYRQ